MRTDVSRSLINSPHFAGVSAVQMRDLWSLPPAEVAIASILAARLWALQTRSWRRAELHMKTARFKSTNRASRIGGTTRQEHRGGERRRPRAEGVLNGASPDPHQARISVNAPFHPIQRALVYEPMDGPLDAGRASALQLTLPA